jgi:DNA repair exonuclease SbcCD ATPase subunit
MRIESLTIENFGSFAGRHDLTLAGRGIVFVVGVNEDDPRSASNGAGKSTLFDALEWALFGEPPKGDAADSVVSETTGEGTAVTVRLTDDGQPITVQRYRKLRGRSGLRVWVGASVADAADADSPAHKPAERTALDKRETQRELERILGLDREVFRAAVYRSQTETFSFADATDAERKDLLTRILRLEEIDHWLEAAKRRLLETQAEWSILSQREAGLVGELRALESVDHAAQVAEWERQREARLEFLRGRYLERRGLADTITTELAREPEIRAQLEAVRARAPAAVSLESDVSGLLGQRRYLTDVVRGLEVQSAEITQEISRARARGVGRCPACGQTIDAAHLEREIARLSESLRTVHASHRARCADLDGLTAELDACQVRVAATRAAHEAALRAHGAEVRQLEIEAETLGRRRGELQAIERDLAGLEASARGIKAETNPYAEAEHRSRERIGEVRRELTTIASKRSALEERRRLVEFWVHGFGPKGLKSYVLDARLAELNEAANQWVKLLTGGTVWVRFETQTLAKTSKTLSDKFNIRVFRWNPSGEITERSFKSWSGGEKARIALGIDFGLSRLVASRASKPYDLLILDEVFRHLDGKGREAVLDLLQHLSAEKSSIFLVDHDQMWRGEFEQTLCVRKRNGRSEIAS